MFKWNFSVLFSSQFFMFERGMSLLLNDVFSGVFESLRASVSVIFSCGKKDNITQKEH
jgi:hypothetical protein